MDVDMCKKKEGGVYTLWDIYMMVYLKNYIHILMSYRSPISK